MGARRVISALAVAGLAGYALRAAFPAICGDAVHAFFEGPVYIGLIATGALLCIWRAAARRPERAAWSAFGAGLAAWAAAEIVYTLSFDELAVPPVFSISDALWLAFYPCSYAGVLLLLRARAPEFRPSLWLDGLVGALALASVGGVLVYEPVAQAAAETGVALDLAFLMGDTLLVGLVVFVAAVTGWRPGGAWGLLGTALVIGAAADAWSLYDAATGAAGTATLGAALWPASALAVGFAAWRPLPDRAARIEEWRLLVMPTLFGLAALGVLILDLLSSVGAVPAGLATAALAMAIARMTLTFHENAELLHCSRHLALTDALSGLGNRRRLMLDLELEVEHATEAVPCGLMLFDLDGFKQYNDRFGHPLGDALITRLGGRLAEAVAGVGRAYRLGGDEFCVVARGSEAAITALAERAREALTERGEGFVVTSSCGLVTIPCEAADSSAALKVADERLYAQKGESRRASVSEQTSSALLQVLRECSPDTGGDPGDVGELALRVGRRLGLAEAERGRLARLAELHDVGTVAIPSEILSKPGALTRDEWRFVHRHPVVGERIVRAAPALADVADAVRATHERWDGRGYPDGVAGQQIPLIARIVAVCDAYVAMTAPRPYRAAMSHEAALEEVRRCAGGQFDPGVVAAFCSEVGLRAESDVPAPPALVGQP